jgi:MYXO-CTERM domain-containing protein
VAKSDAQRLYVSGTDARNPRLGVLLRSDNGGQNWTRSTLALPPGSGSLFVSGIHPTDADRVWLRVAALDDTIGLLPARLYITENKGETFRMLAETQKSMYGFALSPDGSKLAYGGPSDGLYVGPSDGSVPFQKRNALSVRCLRWIEDDALYVCATQPSDPFSVGISSDDGLSFQPLYKLTDTCPAECAAGSSFANSCEAAWTPTRAFISATADMCSVPWAKPVQVLDASVPVEPEPVDAGSEPDAAAPEEDASVELDASEVDEPVKPAASADDGCGCGVQNGRPRGALLALFSVLGALTLRRRRN